MKPVKSVYSSSFKTLLSAGAWCAAVCFSPGSSQANNLPLEPDHASVIRSDSAQPPPTGAPGWKETQIPDKQDSPVVWYRVMFEQDTLDSSQTTALYLPYLYGGGRVWLNGEQIAAIGENSEIQRVRWERPMLIPLPTPLLKAGANTLHLRLTEAHQPSGTRLSRLAIGSATELQSQFDRRLFLVRTVPLITVVFGIVVGIFMIYIWNRQRQEVLFGLFGLAVILWSLRTTTFVFDTLPASVWVLWRVLYHFSTGGFVVVMALFALEMGGWRNRRVTWVLALYALAGPLLYPLSGDHADEWIGRFWAAGLIPIGLMVVIFSIAAARLHRTTDNVFMACGTTLAVLAGVHDYLLAWNSSLIDTLAPTWSQHRIFLMHHGANLLLLLMGSLLAKRFVDALATIAKANQTLEIKLAARETELAQNYERIAVLQREQAALDERQRIMQDLHDGLGSQLFSSLLRAERGALEKSDAVEALRASIDEMRVAIEALTCDELDFRTAFGNFQFRWDRRLRDAGLAPTWTLNWSSVPSPVSSHVSLQILRIVQESLTNVVKHAEATSVRIDLTEDKDQLQFVISDDGRGFSATPSASPTPGRGMRNMRARAQSLAGHLVVEPGSPGTSVRFTLTLAPA